ncbi:MetQ/NlpA family ABC transporter substrate-binding protein [Staphylococcus hominis]|uniref:dipeptide ABC transporter glycylmethionine-binding lipoprotein n=1 Tax=Staphylococcus hominis TaxID=1290 RepID=UPI002879C762|nr:dipeptide ABC transporter glycylmethionine-binding lipoprotein [Staphylococcus hominis]MDS3878382.1 MetQ/NlpA family ABC transporter substrate-binding protein [Staphylococcus hominis]
MKRIIGLLLASIIVLAACSGGGNSKKVTVGVASNDTAAWEKVKELAKKDDIDLEIKHFSDYNVPNKALSDGDIDMNAFQHFAFLNEYKKAHKDAKIEAISTTVLAPLGIYSKKVKDIKDIKDNPKHLKIKEVDAQQTARALDDVDISVINNGVATKAGLDAKKDPIYLESSTSDAVKPYINLIAVNSKDKDNKTYKKIVDLYHSKEAQEALKKDTKDGEKAVDLSQKEIKDIEDSLK